MFCIKCGKQNSEKANYCYNCAARLYKPGEGPADLLTKKKDEQTPASENRPESVASLATPEPVSSFSPPPSYQYPGFDPRAGRNQYNQPPGNLYNPPSPTPYNPPPNEPPVYRYPYRQEFTPLTSGGKPYAVVQKPDAFYSYKNKDDQQVYTAYATFSQRIVAVLIDTLVMSVPLFIIMSFYFLNLPLDQQNALLEQRTDAPATPTWINLLWSTLYLIYCTLLTARKSQTIGKRVMGLKVMLAKDGGIPDLQSAFVRNLFGYCWTLGGILTLIQPLAVFGLLLVMMVLIGFSAVAFNRQRQGWHDRLAGTIVVHKNEYIKGVNY